MGGIYWLASYPKSGNTWFRAFLRNLMGESEEPADINELVTGGIASGRTWLDDVLGFDTSEFDLDEVDRLRPFVYRWHAGQPGIEYHKIHDAWIELDDGVPLVSHEGTLGALYIIRNPLDVASSYASHNGCSIDEAIADMGNSEHAICQSTRRLMPQTRQRLRDWSGHVLSWADADGLDCQVLRFEDMLDDPREAFARAARFLQLSDDPMRIDRAIRFSRFDELRRQELEKGFDERPPGVESFFRQGRSGGWRQKLSDEQVARIVADHGQVMRRFDYLDASGVPI